MTQKLYNTVVRLSIAICLLSLLLSTSLYLNCPNMTEKCWLGNKSNLIRTYNWNETVSARRKIYVNELLLCNKSGWFPPKKIRDRTAGILKIMIQFITFLKYFTFYLEKRTFLAGFQEEILERLHILTKEMSSLSSAVSNIACNLLNNA